MSTHDLNVKFRTRTDALKGNVRKKYLGKQKVGNGNDQCPSGTSTENIQTTKNLYIRRRILLRSKTDSSSTTGDLRETPEQPRFTSFFSLTLPPKSSEKNSTNSRTEAQLNCHELKSEAGRKPTDVHHTEYYKKTRCPSTTRELSDEAAKDENVSEPCYENEGPTQSHQSHAGSDISSHRSTEGIHCGVALRDRANTASCSQRQSPVSDHQTELPVSESESTARDPEVNNPFKENAEGALSHSNLIPFGEDRGSKATTNCQPSACSPRELKRALSLPSFPAPHHSCKLETEPHLIGLTAAMFTSTIVSVLAPHWSGRLRRHKRGVSEVEPDIQVSGQNNNLPASGQNPPQHLFPHTQTNPGLPMFDEFNIKQEQGKNSMDSGEWQKETLSPHLTATFETKRHVLQPIPNQQAVDSKTEFVSSVRSQVPRSPLSPLFNEHQRISQDGVQGESFSPPTSRPTAGSLILSWRRLNSRKTNAEPSEMEKQLDSTYGFLTLPRKSMLRISQPHSSVVSPDDSAKDTSVPYTFSASPEQLQTLEEKKSPVSPGGRQVKARKTMFLNKREFDFHSRTSLDTFTEGLHSKSPTTSSHTETQEQSKEILERIYSHVKNNKSVDDNTDYTHTNKNNTELYSLNTNGIHQAADYPIISPKDNTNNNISKLFSQSCHISDSMGNNYSQPSSCMQSSSTYDENSNNFNTANAPSKSESTGALSSHTRPKTTGIKTLSSLSLGLSSVSLSSHKSVINTSSLSPEMHSPSPNNMTGRTFTNSLVFSPRKEPSPVEGTSPSPVWLNYLNSQAYKSPSDLTSLLSQSRPSRRVHTPSIYSYLRETSPPITTQTSSAFTPSSPRTPTVNQNADEVQKDKNSETSVFTFDLSPVESRVLIQDLCTSSSPQSLPPDTGMRSLPRFSKSPYSTLISTRPALNNTLHNLSSPPVPNQHSKCTPSDTPNVTARTPKFNKSIHKSNLIQGLSEEPCDSSVKQLIMEGSQTSSVFLGTCSCIPDVKYKDCQTVNLIPEATHPKNSDIVIKNFPHKGCDGMFSSQSDKGNTYNVQGLNYKMYPPPSSSVTVSEAANMQERVKTLQTKETLQGVPSTNSKKSLFSKSRKDNTLNSTSSPSKDSSAPQDVKKGVMTGLKSGKRMDQVFNRLKLKFGVKRSEDDDFTNRSTKNLNQQSSDMKALESNKALEMEKCQTLSSNSHITNVRESYHCSGDFPEFTSKKNENTSNVGKHKRLANENGSQFLVGPQSHNRPKPHYINRYATMPQTRKANFGPSSTLYLPEFLSNDAQNDDVFYNNFPTMTKHPSIFPAENFPHTRNAMHSQRQHQMGAQFSASCADLMYGLERKRSVSVTSVVSGRPSGPGRISTGSKQGSVSDLTSSPDEFVTWSKHSSLGSPCDSPGFGARSPSSVPAHNTYKACAGRWPTNDHLWSPVKLEISPCSWDIETDPTPPPSPPFSPTSRRMSQIPSSSSTSSRTSHSSLSPRGILPSKNYKSTLSVFEESSSDTTTDDEYYLNSDDDDDDGEKETEL
ncbi:uncharacterized protein zmp:0000000991 [Hoplias malabaricus]|uniref:uncharacterized protein zmp:0000000991 n=1 Tax=Hoplias malabaricus TaxID=27720 RepID=UPI0034622EDA